MTVQIFSEVTRLTGITRDQMSSRSRKREIIIARHGAISLIKNNTTLTLKQIGALFGRRDHSTVLHGIDCVEDCPPLDRSFRWMANVVLVGEVQAACLIDVSGSLFDHWIKMKYPLMYRDKDYGELDYTDMQDFGFWIEDKINSGVYSNLTIR